MNKILVTEAVAAVRKNLDELSLDGASMFNGEGTDNAALDQTIKRTLPEAINRVVASAPAEMLEGNEASGSGATSLTLSDDGVLSFGINKDVLRIVAFKAADSDVTVCDVVDENSPEGHMQLNKYVRGSYDMPVLVKLQGGEKPTYKYYTIKKASDYADNYAGAIARLSYFEKQVYAENKIGYDAPIWLQQSILDVLTGLVLIIYGQVELAKNFLN